MHNQRKKNALFDFLLLLSVRYVDDGFVENNKNNSWSGFTVKLRFKKMSLLTSFHVTKMHSLNCI